MGVSNSGKVKVTYPDLPADLVTRFNDLIAVLDHTSTHLNTSSGKVQAFMGQANGAVQNVAHVSRGKATQALVNTWYYTTVDGAHADTSMSGVATHLKSAIGALEQHTQAIRNGMATVQSLQTSSGYVAEHQQAEVQQSVDNLTSTLNNIGIALDAAAKLINTINNHMPVACATGFTPGGSHPVFLNTAFDESAGKGRMNMTGNSATEGGPGPGELTSKEEKALLGWNGEFTDLTPEGQQLVKEYAQYLRDFRTFEDPSLQDATDKERASLLAAAQKQWASQLTQQEKLAISAYSDETIFRKIMYYLRTGRYLDNEEYLQNWIKQLDAVFNKATIPENIVVQRAFSLNELDKFQEPIYQNLAYLSTSSNLRAKGVYPFSKRALGRLFIEVPKGSRGAFLGKLSQNSENEVLLPRNAKLQIIRTIDLRNIDLYPSDQKILKDLPSYIVFAKYIATSQ